MYPRVTKTYPYFRRALSQNVAEYLSDLRH
jgi:hypothetical protein